MFQFKLVSLSGVQFDGQVNEVVLPTLEGDIGILQNHMPLIGVATNGVISVRVHAHDADRDREFFATNGGVVSVEDNVVNVLVDEADGAEEINESEAKKALERAEKMKAEAKDQVSLDHAQTLVDRQATRLHVAGLKRRRK